MATELGKWQSFFESTAAASGVLLGLLFVAVSLLANRPERTASIFHMVNQSVIALLYPLIASLVMLIPSGVPTVQAVAAILGGTVGLAGSIGNALRVRRISGLPEPSERPIRYLPAALGSGFYFASGFALLADRRIGIFGVVLASFLMILSGTQNTRDLLFGPPESDHE
ncbi:MAG TPA: hypothetical protein VHL55_07380 [Acidimicrobiia bacterium]|nr:hypothetical protein [Acidimicrobiia bacterium]